MADQQSVLPKGIVLNSDTIYDEIARHDIVPIDKILKSCQVFTTTSRKLYDPTAKRLENFWSRVLGGDRRYLPGSVIARLFKDISETSFVKLRGPANRYEPPSPESLAANAHVTSPPPLQGPEKPVPKAKGMATASSAKMPHPILKKPRGPSTSGPRPTARFVSPPGSGAEESEGISSNLTAAHSADSKDSSSSTAREERRKAPVGRGKKKTTAFVASTASRRRPAMPRRTSSQTSTGQSETGSKDGDSSLGSRYDSQSSVPPIPERPEQPSRDKAERQSAGLSAKAAGKRPATQTHADSSASAISERGKPIRRERQSSGREPSPTEGISGSLPTESGPRYSTSRERRSAVPSTSLMSSTPAKLDTSVIGQGTISGFTRMGTGQASRPDHPDTPLMDVKSGVAHSQNSASPVVPAAFTPTRPSDTYDVPLPRSKSQLSLLLNQKGEKKSKR